MTDQNLKLNLIIFYRNFETKNLIMKNDLSPPKRVIDGTNVIYEYKCPLEDCCLQHKNNRYIGLTTCTLSRRLTYHLQNGSIKDHENACSKLKLTRPKIVQNTKILYKLNDFHKLAVMEAILINFREPALNDQETGKHKTLKLWS